MEQKSSREFSHGPDFTLVIILSFCLWQQNPLFNKDFICNYLFIWEVLYLLKFFLLYKEIKEDVMKGKFFFFFLILE